MTERILVVDPGERVGWAHANITSNGVEVTGHGITPLKDFALKLHEVAGNYDTIIYESVPHLRAPGQATHRLRHPDRCSSSAW
jgi:hypothetical protein